MGNRLDEVLHQHDQPGVHQQRQQDGPVGIAQVQRLHHQQIEGHQAGGEQRGEVDVEHDAVAEGEVLALQGVARHGDNEQAHHRADHRQKDGDDIRADHLVGGAEEQLIGIGGEVGGPQGEARAADGFLRGEGGGNDHPEGQDAAYAEDGNHHIGNAADHHVGFIQAHLGGAVVQVCGLLNGIGRHDSHFLSFEIRTARNRSPASSQRRWRR